MRNLLIVWHSQTGHTDRMARAVIAGATDPAIEAVAVRTLRAAHARARDLRWAHGLLLGTPENFGYMSGALKDFFDRTFYAVEGQLAPLPCGYFISAGNDGSGALRAIRRIAPGYPLREVAEPVVIRGVPDADADRRCQELGMTLAAGLDAGIF